MTQPKAKQSSVIGTIYGHPNENIKVFTDEFCQCLEQLTNEKKTYYIAGGFNINIDESNPSSQAVNLLNSVERNGAFHLIIKPTIVTDYSATVIDHVITIDTVHLLNPFIILSVKLVV